MAGHESFMFNSSEEISGFSNLHQVDFPVTRFLKCVEIHQFRKCGRIKRI